ncbi:hypothetical protein [Terrabacter sp. NPDC080008]|uniref:hypothetical protein n=1 Tax=Terrabacter sp. NPDC080008 TaxID=3155176 RepID=UPI00344E2460
MLDSVMPYVLALVPTIGVATLFYFVIKSILEGDRRERLAQARWDAEHRADTEATNASRTGTDSGDSTPRSSSGQA